MPDLNYVYFQDKHMGLGILGSPTTIFQRKDRWMFKINSGADYIGADDTSANVLPPLKGGKPQLEFKNIEVPHLIEDINFPGKPIWKPINLTLYSICPPKNHPVWQWIKKAYDVQQGFYYPILDNSFKTNCSLEIYSGCGEIIEEWHIENGYPSSINFGDLDMSSDDIVTCDLTITYDRAYLIQS